jgi:hypothetical protein
MPESQNISSRRKDKQLPLGYENYLDFFAKGLMVDDLNRKWMKLQN